MTNTIIENNSTEAVLENGGLVIKGSPAHILNFRCPIAPVASPEFPVTFSNYNPELSMLFMWPDLKDATKSRELGLRKQLEAIMYCLRVENSKQLKLKLIKEHPVLGKGAIVQLNSTKISQVDAMLSRTYSDNKQLAAQKVKEIFAQNTINIEMVRDVLSVIVLGIAKGEDYPFTKSVKANDFDGAVQEEIKNKCGNNELTYLFEKAEPLRMIFETSDIFFK